MRAETYILAFDTSAAHCAAALIGPIGAADSAAALIGPQGTIESTVEEMAKGQAERLVPMLEEMLARAGLGWRDLAAIGVGIGPGNFTGVRIAVSLARGLALGLGVPAIGVSVLEAKAHRVARPCLAVEDAKRGAVYLQGFGAEPLEPCLSEGALPDLPLANSPVPLALAIAEIALARLHEPQPRPAPLYLRAADAAPPADPPPVILP